MYFDFRKETNDAIETNDLDENKKHDNFRRVFARCARTKLTNKMEIWSVFIAAARSDFHVVCSRQAVNRNPTLSE